MHTPANRPFGRFNRVCQNSQPNSQCFYPTYTVEFALAIFIGFSLIRRSCKPIQWIPQNSNKPWKIHSKQKKIYRKSSSVDSTEFKLTNWVCSTVDDHKRLHKKFNIHRRIGHIHRRIGHTPANQAHGEKGPWRHSGRSPDGLRTCFRHQSELK